MKSFDLTVSTINGYIPYNERLIKFAMSHSVENLSLNFHRSYYEKLPDFLYNSSSFKQLNIALSYYCKNVPVLCTVSWTSLHKLSLTCGSLSDEAMAKILSGCPVLENLSLNFLPYYDCMFADIVNVLDLSKSLRLRALEVIIDDMTSGPRPIVAPQIHYLRLYDPQSFCTLVNVSSLTEAELDISCVSMNFDFIANFLQARVLKMLDKLKNAEKLRLGSSFIQILSKIDGVPFPILKVKTLTLDTEIFQYVIPVIERLLQTSPDLETLTLGACNTTPVEILDKCLKLQGFNVNKCWRSKNGASWTGYCRDAKLEHVGSVLEKTLRN